jgi:hypothetical protein
MRAGLRLAVAALALVSFPSTPTGRYERTGKDKMRLAVAQRRTREPPSKEMPAFHQHRSMSRHVACAV